MVRNAYGVMVPVDGATEVSPGIWVGEKSTSIFAGVFAGDGSFIEVPDCPKDVRRHFDRRALILREAERLQMLADSEQFMIPFGGCDFIERDAYRDMAVALRLLADERGT